MVKYIDVESELKISPLGCMNGHIFKFDGPTKTCGLKIKGKGNRNGFPFIVGVIEDGVWKTIGKFRLKSDPDKKLDENKFQYYKFKQPITTDMLMIHLAAGVGLDYVHVKAKFAILNDNE